LRQAVQAVEFAAVDGDHDLAVALDRHAVLVAERLHLALALGAPPRLRRPGGVVQPGVQHPRVPRRLLRADGVLGLEDDDGQIRSAFEEPVRGGEAHQATTDDRDVHGCHGLPPVPGPRPPAL
jgi:hypothetical protein